MLLKVKVDLNLELVVPDKTEVIRNDSWLTLISPTIDPKRPRIFRVITCKAEDAANVDFSNDSSWTDFTDNEIKSMNKFVTKKRRTR